MNEIEVYNEYEMLRGNINRMFLTDDINELFRMYYFARKRLDGIIEYNYARLNNELYLFFCNHKQNFKMKERG